MPEDEESKRVGLFWGSCESSGKQHVGEWQYWDHREKVAGRHLGRVERRTGLETPPLYERRADRPASPSSAPLGDGKPGDRPRMGGGERSSIRPEKPDRLSQTQQGSPLSSHGSPRFLPRPPSLRGFKPGPPKQWTGYSRGGYR